MNGVYRNAQTQCIIVDSIKWNNVHLYNAANGKDCKCKLIRNEMHILFLNETHRTRIDK